MGGAKLLNHYDNIDKYIRNRYCLLRSFKNFFPREGEKMSATVVKEEPGNTNWKTALDFLWLEITRACNLQCVHCYADAGPSVHLTGEMGMEDWRRLLKEGYELGCRAVQFIGGEPTISPHLPQLIVDAKAVGFDFLEVYTNGTRLNERLLETLRAAEVHLAFSLYASRAGVHDDVTQRKGSFEKTVHAIRRSLELGIPVRVGIIKMAANADETRTTIEMLKEIGVSSVGVDRVRGIGRGHGLVPVGEPFQELCGSCWKGKLCVDPDGNAFPCVFSSFYPLGNVKKNGLSDTIANAKLGTFRERVRAQEARLTGCPPNLCSPAVCPPASKPCGPECAPACNPCRPDIFGRHGST